MSLREGQRTAAGALALAPAVRAAPTAHGRPIARGPLASLGFLALATPACLSPLALAMLATPATLAALATPAAAAMPQPDPPAAADPAIALAQRVEIHRTEYGVPHIFADDLEAMGFGLGYVQSEDYSMSIAMAMLASRGTLARHLGPEELDGDFAARPVHARAVETFHRLDPRTQNVYRGFAEGVNHYIRLHPAEFPDWVTPDFTGVDALARDVQGWSRADAARFVSRLREEEAPEQPPPSFALDGSNAWAFHGTRTASGNTILLRNPHLPWEGQHDLLERPSGLIYYEGHVRVPGVIDFYGDLRIGTAFGIIGGFNARLGWATTNNYPTLSQVYKLRVHPDLADHAFLDGRPLPLERRETTVDYRTHDGDSAVETRVSWHTPHGPVIHRTGEHVYLLKDPRDGEFRRGEQFLRMMMAQSLDEWLDVMKMRAHPTSNFTYADRDGNIVHYYNARLPLLPHPVTGDTAAFATTSGDIWSELVPWESLPLYVNPPGGFVQQANDTPDYTNLNVPMDRDTVPHNLPEPRLRLRSQLSLELAAGGTGAAGTAERDGRPLTREDVVALKHTPRMFLAERVTDDLLAAARAASDPGVQEAVEVLSNWDLTADADSRGGVLFARWANRYFDGDFDGTGNESSDATSNGSGNETAELLRWREPWDPSRPAATPYGLGNPDEAVRALGWAVESLRAEGIALDAAWGQVHRVIRGDVDEPVSGCPPTLGCFRVLSFAPTEDGRRAANRGDSWVFVVEFEDVPRARTVLAYGQTARAGAPHHADQAAMFARGQTKEIAWTDEDIRRTAIVSYRPGEETRR
ncbi:MAG: penicillin acylase family protein [Gemmatimonadetes bacterium]|nr:penicillin acylase family protein [Gemmatimonadota bacterium]